MACVGRDFKDQLVSAPCLGQGFQPMEQNAQEPNKPGLECLQGCGIQTTTQYLSHTGGPKLDAARTCGLMSDERDSPFLGPTILHRSKHGCCRPPMLPGHIDWELTLQRKAQWSNHLRAYFLFTRVAAERAWSFTLFLLLFSVL